jgi:hypothetical protein
MSEHVLESSPGAAVRALYSRRQHAAAPSQLVLTELDPLSVIDCEDLGDAPLDLHCFGAVREACPKCGGTHLKLILRQESVRAEHLFCTGCESCFDAHYENGARALAI